MEGEVARELGINDGIMLFLVVIHGVDGLHTHVETNDEIVEVQSQSQTIAYSYLLPEVIEMELSLGLLLIVSDGPDVTGIQEQGAIELPEELGTVLHIQVELHITGLVDEVYASVTTDESTRTQRAHTPASHTIGTA